AGDVTLSRVARVTALPAEFVLAADVEEHEARVTQPGGDLLPRRHGVEPRLELGAGLVELHDAGLELALPACHSAREHRHPGMAGELGDQQRRGGGDAVAAVVEDEALLAG